MYKKCKEKEETKNIISKLRIFYTCTNQVAFKMYLVHI